MNPNKPIAHIDRWCLMGNTLVGQISDHPRQDEFERAYQVTSELVSFHRRMTVAETQNTNYILGRRHCHEEHHCLCAYASGFGSSSSGA